MSRIKRILVTLIIAIVSILGMFTISEAYSVGQGLSINYGIYAANSNIFCVQHGQYLRSAYTPYKIISQVRIVGNESTDYKGKKITNKANAKLAAILNEPNKAITKHSVWNYMYTWMSLVGKNHAGLNVGFASNVPGSSVSLDTTSSDYANKLQDTKITDNTKKSKVKAVATTHNKKEYIKIGPFNWSFAGNLTGIKAYNQDDKSIKDLEYITYNGKDEKWVNLEDIKTGGDFYIGIPLNTNISSITKIEGTIKYDVKAVNIWFLESQWAAYQNLIIREPYTDTDKVTTEFDYDISIKGSLKVIKVNKDNHEVKLPNVGFHIKNKETGKYVALKNGKITYQDTPYEFKTDSKGKILIKDLIVGTYVAYETKNPNYGYEMISKNGVEKTVVVDKTTDFVIENKQKYVKLSGYVWVDGISEKTSNKNGLYKEPEKNGELFDNNDNLFDGITVRLKNKNTGKVIDEKITENGGAYLFKDVLIEELANYYIEFEYDGLTYTNVVPNISKDNGSKSAESSEDRDNFNKNFSVIDGNAETTGFAKDEVNGNVKHNLSYNVDKSNNTSTLINNGQYKITANTDVAKYYINKHFKYGQEEIKYINLGLTEREQPNIAIKQDIDNVQTEINGYGHTYQYAQRFGHPEEYGGDGFNVGVKFSKNYNTSYYRAVYEADYEYESENKDNELKLTITYQIRIKNLSTNLVTQVHSIIDYFDTNYELIGSGSDLNNITKQSETQSYNANYNKTIIPTASQIAPQEEQIVYVQFRMNREAVINVLNGSENLENVVEINNYSTYQDGKIYAGIDINSNPANCNPEDKTTYQDDTDASPSLILELADARRLVGTVFIDGTEAELKPGEVRQGDGKYDPDREGKVSGVEVTLSENAENGKVYIATTNENGNFEISNYIPGDYTLTYTWGDTTYTVQNYKGTVYNSSRDQANKEWYKQDVDTRYTDAIDNWQTRQEIDEEIKTITNSTQITKTKMDSKTPIMGIGVEYETTTTASIGDKYIYEIKNVDFGIVERARQDLALSKRAKTVKLTLANGQEIIDFEIDDNGNITGERAHVAYVKPDNSTNGTVKIELDDEIIQGATLSVGYEIKATNNSECDYLSENFYKYGIVEGNVVTIKPSAIIDYLDKDWTFDPQNNSGWESKTIEDIKNIVAEEVYNNEETEINDKIILYTENLKDKSIEPNKSETTMLNVSKLLSVSDEIWLNNETEITKIEKTGGSKIVSTPGNYIPGKGNTETDDSMAETVIVTPSTGEDRAYIIYIGIGFIALTILGVGTIAIKKKAIK